MVKVQRRVAEGMELLQYFTTKNWSFSDKNMKKLYAKLNVEDQETFNFNMSQASSKLE
jgi:fatty acyl-CoA reductase